ncbi:MAG: choice-of-anchor B family protein [candidate division Zixibacteria bacterium]|nr:choice-of-anchor B family protein [candidate division Zixibacteria bacterium]
MDFCSRSLASRALTTLGISLMLSFTPAQSSAQGFNMTQLATVPGGLRSVWGYTDSLGREFALACAGNSLKIVNVTVPGSPVVVATVPTVGNDLKEVKTYLHYAYVVNQAGAMQIVELGWLPDSAKTVATFSSPTVPGQHAIWIDSSYVYLGMNGAGLRDYRILDLANPVAPVELSGTPHPTAACGAFADAHDSYVVGNLAFVANLSSGFMSVDVTNRSAPVILGKALYNGAFTHSMRTSADGQYLFTTDETNDGHLRVWDVSDPANMVQVAEYPKPGAIIHNVFLADPWLYASYYADGVRIFDVSDPLTPVIVGQYDTYLQGSGNTFNGCWDVYPYFASGTIVTSDITNGLAVLTFNDTRAGYLEGTITDAPTGDPVPNATINWTDPASGANNTATTAADGTYRLGVPSNSINITVARSGYANNIQVFTPASIVVTTHSVALNRSSGGRLGGTVSNLNANSSKLPELRVFPNNPGIISTDNAGAYAFANMPSTNYVIYAGQWGRKNVIDTVPVPVGSLTTLPITLTSGYEDNFELNLGWTTTSPGDSAASGRWERVNPNGTITGAFPVQPENDAGGGADSLCFITAQALVGGSIGSTDVDNGQTTLTTPSMDMSTSGDPQVSYDRWYTNNRGGNPNLDAWVVQISNDSGLSWVTLENTSVSNATWVSQTFRVLDFVTLTNKVLVRFVASDDCLGSIVEAGVDNFKVVDLAPPTCCVGNSGNTDNDLGDVVDISDITALIDHLFISLAPLFCPEEGNIDGDLGAVVDISDLTALIDHLFISLAPTAPCQ